MKVNNRINMNLKLLVRKVKEEGKKNGLTNKTLGNLLAFAKNSDDHIQYFESSD